MLDVPRMTDVTQARDAARWRALAAGMPGCIRTTSRASTPIDRCPIFSESPVSIAASITSSGSSSKLDAGDIQRRYQRRQIVAGDAEMAHLACFFQRGQSLAHGGTDLGRRRAVQQQCIDRIEAEPAQAGLGGCRNVLRRKIDGEVRVASSDHGALGRLGSGQKRLQQRLQGAHQPHFPRKPLADLGDHESTVSPIRRAACRSRARCRPGRRCRRCRTG